MEWGYATALKGAFRNFRNHLFAGLHIILDRRTRRGRKESERPKRGHKSKLRWSRCLRPKTTMSKVNIQKSHSDRALHKHIAYFMEQSFKQHKCARSQYVYAQACARTHMHPRTSCSPVSRESRWRKVIRDYLNLPLLLGRALLPLPA